MMALVYQGPGAKTIEEHAKPEIIDGGDAMVRITHTTICGTALTEGRGVDTSVEAVGVPTTFELCQNLVAPRGRHSRAQGADYAMMGHRTGDAQ